jgi:hypothetical protein
MPCAELFSALVGDRSGINTMSSNYESPFTDAADRTEASYEAHPVDTIEPESMLDPTPEQQWAAIKAEGAAVESLFRWIVEPLEIKR